MDAGTVTNVKEAVAWLGYTYLFVRMRRNPLAYGVAWEEVAADPELVGRRQTLIRDAARELERCKMARFDERSGNLYVTDLGRVASHFYVRHSSIVVFNEHLHSQMSESEVSMRLEHGIVCLLRHSKAQCLREVNSEQAG